MSAINLYTTKAEALYFKDSQRNNFYEFGGIQLIPNNTYTQKSSGIELGNRYSVEVYSVDDNSYLGTLPITTISEEINGNEIYADSTSLYAYNTTLRVDSYLTGDLYWSVNPMQDFGNELLYLKLSYNGNVQEVDLNYPYTLTLVQNTGLNLTAGASQTPACCNVNLIPQPSSTTTTSSSSTTSTTTTLAPSGFNTIYTHFEAL